MRVLIVEDEHFAFERLSMLIKRVDKSIEIVAHAKSIREAVEHFKQKNFDLAFVDIQLADGLSFGIFDQVEVDCPLIFTTAYEQHAIRAFKLNSVDYLLKPIRQADLAEALNKYDRIWKAKKDTSLLLKQAMENVEYKDRFVIKVGEYIKVVKSEDISCFYSFAKGTYVHTIENRNYLIDFSLEEVSSLVNPEDFFRVNRKFIVKLDQIEDMIAYSNSRIKVKMRIPPDEDIIVARERVKEFKTWLGAH